MLLHIIASKSNEQLRVNVNSFILFSRLLLT